MKSSGILILFSVFISSVSWGEGKTNPIASPGSSAIKPVLSETQRDSLRYHLENLYNEVDLLIRNQRVDRSDLQKQEGDLATLKVFERIPLNPDLKNLRTALEESASNAGFLLRKFRFLPRDRAPEPVPSSIYTDSTFHLSEDQLVEKIKFVMQVQGQDVKKWADLLPQTVLRYVKADRVEKGGDSWKIEAHAFRFRKIQFPRLKPKSPLVYLPLWARKNPTRFAKTEPVLWKFVQRIEVLTPNTPPLYETRRQFLLNDARLTYYLKITK